MDLLPARAEEFDRRANALSEPSFVDNLISADGSMAGLLLEMDAYPDDRVDPRKDIPPVVRGVLASPQYADLTFTPSADRSSTTTSTFCPPSRRAISGSTAC